MLQPPESGRLPDRGHFKDADARGRPGAAAGTDWAGLLAVPPDRRRSLPGHHPRDYVSGSVATASAPHPTRLETRTKESNTRASHWALRNPKAQ